MKRSVRWMLPVTAAVAMVVGMASVTAQAEEKAKTGSVTGTVVDKDGKGVAAIEVRLIKPGMRRGGPGGGGGEGGQRPAPQADLGGLGARELQEGEKPAGPPPGGRPQPVATATTDKDGKFEMKDVPAGEYMVGVRDQEKKIFGGARVTVKEGEAATVEIKTSDTPPQRGGGGGGRGGAGGGGQPN